MYREHFQLKERPFVHGPGQRCFTANAGMSDAVGRLRHVLTARDSVAVVTGGPGVGKSTIAECAVAAVPDGVRTARVDLRFGDPAELYAAILLSLGQDTSGMQPVQALYALRTAMGSFARDERPLVLLLDVAALSAEVARHLLRLVNLAGEQGCQLNLVLMGPHPLHQQVDVPAMIQLRQRIAFRYRVRPLTVAETDRYIRHQLEAVGAEAGSIVSSTVAAAVYCYVAGVPRLINTLMDATLAEAALQSLQRPDGGLIKRAAEGLGWKPMTPPQGTADVRPAPVPARAPAPPAARPATPKVAAVPGSAPERREAPRAVPVAAEAKTVDLPPPSEITMQLRADDAIAGTREPAPTLASADNRSATAALFGGAGAAAAAAPVPMDDADTSATGMLRLQDLDDRFAETVFGKESG